MDLCEDDVEDCVVHQLTAQRIRDQTYQPYPVHWTDPAKPRGRPDNKCRCRYYKYRLRQWFLEDNVQIAPVGNLTHLQQRREVHMSWFENHLVGREGSLKRAYENTMEVSGEVSSMPDSQRNLCLENQSTEGTSHLRPRNFG
jgi:hypothetical protein